MNQAGEELMGLIYAGEWCGKVVFKDIPFRKWLLSLLPWMGMLRLIGNLFARFSEIAVQEKFVGMQECGGPEQEL